MYKIRELSIRCFTYVLLLTGIVVFNLHPLQSLAQPTGLKKGDKVRITAPKLYATMRIGRISGLSDTTLQVTIKHSVLDIPYASISKLEVAKGKKYNFGPMVIITFLGAGSGYIFSTMATTLKGKAETYFIAAGSTVIIAAILFRNHLATTRWKEIPVKPTISFTRTPFESHGYNPLITLRFSLN